MWLKIIIICSILKQITGFKFLHPDDTTKVYYKYQESVKTKVTFNINKQVTDVPKQFDEAWDALRTPFNISFEDTFDAQESTLLQAEDFFLSTVKITNIDTRYENLIKGLTQIPLDIEIDNTINIKIDERSVNQGIKNVNLTAVQIELMMKDAVTNDALKNDKNKLRKFLFAYDNLNSDARTLVKQYEDFFNTIHLTSYKIMTDNLRDNIMTKSSKKIDTVKYEFLNSYIENNHPVFIIQLHYLKNPIEYVQLYSIPYNNMSLDTNYILIKNTDHIEQLHTQEEILQNIAQSNAECLANLNLLKNNKSSIYNILNHCQFRHNIRPYQPTKDGIILYNINNMTINSINTQFNITMNQTHLPLMIKFNQTLYIDTLLYGNRSFTKSHKLKLISSSFTTAEQSYISLSNIHIAPITDLLRIDSLLLENYPIIIVTISLTTTLFAFLLILTSAKQCCQPQRTTLKDLVESRRKKQERNRRAYRLSQY